MFLPFGDAPNPKGWRPWVNWLLIAANVVIFLLSWGPRASRRPDPEDPRLVGLLEMLAEQGIDPSAALRELSAYDVFLWEHGYIPADPQWMDLLSGMFLHGGWAHLGGNLLFLWIYGDNVEHRLGRLGYLLTYLGAGAASTLFYAQLMPGSETPLVGASGAISGVLGLYFLLFPANRVKVIILLPFYFDVVLISARVVLGIYVVMDNLLPLLAGQQSGVAHGAHIGGFLAGLAVAFVGEKMAWTWPWREPAPTPQGAPGVEALGRLRAAMEEGAADEALALLPEVPREALSALPARQLVLLASWSAEAGWIRQAHGLLSRGLRAPRDPSGQALLHLGLGQLYLLTGQGPSAYKHLVRALKLDPEGETAPQARALIAQLGIPPEARRG